MSLRRIEEGNETLIKVINHFNSHYADYDDEMLNHSMRIMNLDPEMVVEEVRNIPSFARLIDEQIYQLENESENESLPIEEEIQDQSDEDDTSADEAPGIHVRMNKGTANDEFKGFKVDPEAESSEQASKKRKAEKPMFMPSKAKLVQGGSLDSTILDIDCQVDRKKRIDRWYSEMDLIVSTNPDAYTSADKIRALLEHKSTGIAERLIKGTKWTATKPEDAIIDVVIAFYAAFLGINYATDSVNELEKRKEKSRAFLTKMQLCDICNLSEFNCAFEKHFYELDEVEWPKYIEMYFIKIPFVGDKASTRFKNEAKAPMHMSLGLAMKLVSEEISQICELSKKQKKLKKFNKKCCSFLADESTEFGCKPEKKYKKSYKKKYKKFYKKRSFKRSKKKFTSGKYFKPKTLEGKAKHCPKGKKNCRCWICSEEGHYANECPNRKQFPDKIKIIEIAENYGLEPIEEAFKGYEEVFYATLEEPPDSNSESSDESESESSD